MSEAQQRAIQVISLEDAAFFAFGEGDVVRLQEAISAAVLPQAPPPPPGAADAPEPAEPPQLLAVAGPRQVDMARHQDVPLLVASLQTGLRRWEVKYNQNASLVVADLGSGAVYTGQPFRAGKREQTPEPSMSGPRPEGLKARSTTTSVRKVDVARVVGLKMQPARLAVTALLYDWVSNTVRVDLVGESDVASQAPGAVASDFLESSERTERTPELAGRELALAVPEAVEAGAPIPIHGAAAIPLPPSTFLPEETAPETATPILPATLLILKRDGHVPQRVDLRIPVHTAGQAEIGQGVEVFFGLDLRDALPGADLSGTRQLYLVIGEKLAGPFPLTVGGA